MSNEVSENKVEQPQVVNAQAASEGRDGEDKAPRGKGKTFFRKKVCRFCANKAKIDYKDSDGLKRFTTERGSVDITLNRYVSRSGKSWSYISPAISDADVAVITGLDMSIYKYLHEVEVNLYSDMRCEMNIYARKSENNPWKFRYSTKLDNSIITIL